MTLPGIKNSKFIDTNWTNLQTNTGQHLKTTHCKRVQSDYPFPMKNNIE
jgi:hypothetical protein